MLDQIRLPAWPNLVAYLDEMAGDEGLLASWVVSSAGAVPADDDVLHVNTVGTLEVSSAGYWWSRLESHLRTPGS